MTNEIQIDADWCASATLHTALERELESNPVVKLELRPAPHAFRGPGLDSNVLIAVVGGASAAITALIAGIFSVASKKGDSAASIVLRGSDGTSVQAPASTTPERLEELVELAGRLQKPRILLRSGKSEL
jgi:hypothetical protein